MQWLSPLWKIRFLVIRHDACLFSWPGLSKGIWISTFALMALLPIRTHAHTHTQELKLYSLCFLEYKTQHLFLQCCLSTYLYCTQTHARAHIDRDKSLHENAENVYFLLLQIILILRLEIIKIFLLEWQEILKVVIL